MKHNYRPLIGLLPALLLFCNAAVAQLGNLKNRLEKKVNKTAEQTGESSKVVEKASTTATWSLYNRSANNWVSELSKEQLVTEATRSTGRQKIAAYQRVKKDGEAGDFHFAKDYAELKDVTEAPDEYGAVSFSDKPFTAGGQPKNSFTSADHIYGMIRLKPGQNFKTLFGIPDKGGERNKDIESLQVMFELYKDGHYITSSYGVMDYVFISMADQQKNVFYFDIKQKPELTKTVYMTRRYRSEEVAYQSSFYRLLILNDGECFRKGGKFLVRAILSNKPVDAWGKEKEEPLEAIADFEFQYNEADTPAIIKDYKTVLSKQGQ